MKRPETVTVQRPRRPDQGDKAKKGKAAKKEAPKKDGGPGAIGRFLSWYMGKKPGAKGRAPAAPVEPAAVGGQAKLLALAKVQTYRLFGRYLESESPHLTASLERADFAVSPGLFRGLMVGAALAGFAVVSVLASIGFVLVLGLPGLAYGVLVGALAAAASAGAFPFVLKSRIQNRANAIDKELPFSLSELSVLAGIGLSPIVLMRRMALRKHDPAVTGAFRQITAMVDTEGRDLVSAMAETARKSPSDALRTTLWDMANLMHQGGDLESYLKGQSETVLEEVRASQKAFTESLGTYADMYISIVLLGIMFLAVGAFILDAFRSTAGPISANGLLLLLTWGLGPLIVIVLGLLLSSAHGSSSG